MSLNLGLSDAEFRVHTFSKNTTEVLLFPEYLIRSYTMSNCHTIPGDNFYYSVCFIIESNSDTCLERLL
jgi:hypothetical protein